MDEYTKRRLISGSVCEYCRLADPDHYDCTLVSGDNCQVYWAAFTKQWKLTCDYLKEQIHKNDP